MKFFLEFVYCCGSPCRPVVPTTATNPRPADEARFLAAPSNPTENRRYRSRKRGRVAASRSVSAAEWRPSLHAISEDNVVAEREERATVGSERVLKRKAAPAARSHGRNHTDDFRRAPSPAIIPTFSPTPFLF